MWSKRTGGLLIAGAIVAGVVACSDNSGPSGGLTGSYTLDTVKVDTSPPLFPPIATGSLVFSAPANFVVGLVLHPPAVPADSTITLGGTYTLAGSDSIKLLVFGAVTIPGTHVETGNKLVLNVLIPAGLFASGATAVHLVWHK